MCIYTQMSIYIYIYIYRERERERDMYIHISIYICSPPLLDLVAPGCFMQADLNFVILDHHVFHLFRTNNRQFLRRLRTFCLLRVHGYGLSACCLSLVGNTAAFLSVSCLKFPCCAARILHGTFVTLRRKRCFDFILQSWFL